MGLPSKRKSTSPASMRGRGADFRSQKRIFSDSNSVFSGKHSLQATNSGVNTPVSRAENKLAGATEAFRYDFRGKIVLDIGSSTGGFTEFALARGAKKVIAIEKGTNQMKAPLRFDPRIELHEKTDIFSVKSTQKHSTPAQTHSGEAKSKSADVSFQDSITIDAPDVILADVSFISLKKVLTHAKAHISTPNTDFLVMLKPQFEARPDQLHKGIVKNEKIRREIIKSFELWLSQNGFIIKNKRDNSLAGKNGNLERFYLLQTSSRQKQPL